MTNNKWTMHREGRGGKFLRVTLACLLTALMTLPAHAQTREQAKRIHDRLAGVPPSETVLSEMQGNTGTAQVCTDNGVSGPACAAYIAMDNPSFYSVTLKNFVAPWTNESRSVFVPLNDYTATVIGMIRDDVDFRTVLSADLQYIGRPGTVTAAPAANSNDHYEQLETGNENLKDVLVATTQSSINGIPSTATAGVITSRAAAEAFFVAGTNRAMFRFTMINHFCKDMAELHDPRLPTDRIRQDVSRSPGGDSRLFLNSCVGCHTGMDPMTQAFAYYNYNETTGALEYTNGVVQPKYFNNDLTFPQGYITPDDHWSNYWRSGQNRYLGFNGPGNGEGDGAKSLGVELANSDAFAKCQVEKVFRAVCLRSPETAQDHGAVANIVQTFSSSGYKMKQVFADTAVYCMGQ